MTEPSIAIAIAGLGSVGRVVAERIVRQLPEYHLTAVAAYREERAQDFLNQLGCDARIVPLAQLADHAQMVVECAPASMFRELAEPVIDSGGRLVVLSAGALLGNWDLVEKAATRSAQILVPSGGLLALDAVQAAAQGEIHSVQMITRKPLAGLKGSATGDEGNSDSPALREPKLLFEGTARQAIADFPANLNVAVALSLAGIGPDRTMLEVWMDPHIDRNTHSITVDSDSARFEFRIENIPSENPRTARLAALSVVALLRKLVNPLRIGT